MHIEQSTVGSSWVAVNTMLVNKCNNVSQKHLRRPHFNALRCVFLPKRHGIEFVSNFRVHSSVLRSFFSCGTRTKGTSIREAKRNRGNSSQPATDASFYEPFPLFTAAELFVADRSVHALIHRSHVKISAINFGRAVVVSLEPPYFHTQGGLQKYEGGATCGVMCVRGLVHASRGRAAGQNNSRS